MYERKESKGGSYYPAFLCLDVNTPDDLWYLGRYPIDERTEAVFLHEFIHYLQDLTTIAGLARIETVIDQIKWVCSKARKHHKLKIPVNTDTWAYNIKPNANSLAICKGDMKLRDLQGRAIDGRITTIVSFELTDTTILYSSGQSYKGKATSRLTFRDQNNILRTFDVGEMAISESMAYLIENRVYPNILVQPAECPYFVVRRIAEWKLQRELDDLVLIALCDVCLMYSLPGIALYAILEELASTTAPITPAFIYVYGLGQKMAATFSRVKNWEDELYQTNNTAKKQFSDMFIHKYWGDFEEVTDAVFDAAYTLRTNWPTFFLDIARGGRLNLNNEYKKVIDALGCLSIKTAANQVYNFLPRVVNDKSLDSDWFLSLHQFYNILFTTSAIKNDTGGNPYLEKECDLKEWCHWSFCKKKERDLTTESPNCKWSPWLNVSDEDLTQCSFGRLWTTLGFNRVKLKI